MLCYPLAYSLEPLDKDQIIDCNRTCDVMILGLKQGKPMTNYQCLCFWTVMWEYFVSLHQNARIEEFHTLKIRIQSFREGLVKALRDYSPDDTFKIVYHQKLEEWYYLRS